MEVDLGSPRKRQKLEAVEPILTPHQGSPESRIKPPAEEPAEQVHAMSGPQVPNGQLAKELEVGITAFVSSDASAFSGILKKRYTDFLVNEILPSGRVLHLKSFKPARLSRENDSTIVERTSAEIPEIADAGKDPEAVLDRDAGMVDQHNGAVDAEAAGLVPDEKTKAEPPSQIAGDDRSLLKEYFGEKAADELTQLYSRIQGSANVKPRELGLVTAPVTTDRSLRTKIHQDIRRIFGSKIESSTDKQGAMILSAARSAGRRPSGQQPQSGNQRGRGKVSWDERGGEYLHFTIYKENKDTMEVMFFLARQLKMNVKAFQFAGTKDRRAVTVQRASAYRIEVERLAAQNKLLRNANIGDYEYHKNGLELGDLKGNEFLITLRDCKWQHQQNLSITEKISEVTDIAAKSLQDLREKGYFNYYGLQRFGTFSARTDAIGIKILQGDFKGACDAILTFTPEALAAAQDPTSTELIGGEDKGRAEAIHIFQSTGKVNEALDKLPRKFSAESNIIRHLGRNENDHAGAVLMVQRNLRLMYVHAYQSLVWNFAVGERWRLYGSKVVEGDLVMVNEHKDKSAKGATEDVDADGEVVIQPSGDDRAHNIDDIFERARALTAEEAEKGAYSIFDVVLPLPGYDIIYPPNSMTDFYKTFMSSERGGGLDPHDMRRKQRDYSLSGSYRKILARIEPGYRFKVMKYSNDDEQFVETDLDRIKTGSSSSEDNDRSILKQERQPQEGDKLALVLKMQLGSSQYATMALRELMKGGAAPYKPEFGGGR